MAKKTPSTEMKREGKGWERNLQIHKIDMTLIYLI